MLSTRKTHYLILVSWASLVIVGFAMLNFQRLQTFDPTGKLKDIDVAEFGDLVESVTASRVKNAVVHFSQNECTCNVTSERHIKQLNKLAKKHNYSIQTIEVGNDSFIPSTPSVAILDGEGKVVYFGPYGEGLECTQTNGFVLTVFNNLLLGFSAELVVEQAQGCYCNT